MPALKAIIFDMDGTLADTEEIHRQAFNLAFAEFRLPWQWSPDEYRELLAISGGRERIRSDLQARKVSVGGPRALWRRAEAIHVRKSEIYRELLVGGSIRLRPGVERLIGEALRTRIRLAVATSSSRSNLEALISNTLGPDAMRWFRAIVTCDIVEDKKPSPAVYQFALAELGLEPECCVAIEDTRNGNLAALAAGLRTVITTHAYTRDSDFKGASLVVDSLGEPGSPFQVMSGDSCKSQFVDIQLLRQLVRRDTQSAQENWEVQAVLTAK